MVTINKANITAAEVATAAKTGGVDLKKLAAQLEALAQNMSFGDGQALQQLAGVIGDAASQAGGSTSHGGGGFDPNAGGSTPQPGR